MASCFLLEDCAACHCLAYKAVCCVAGNSVFYCGIGIGFHDHVHEGRTTSADCSSDSHQRCIKEFNGSKGLEKFNRLFKFFSLQRILLFKKHNALTYHCRCIRHDALNPCVVWINGRIEHIVEGIKNPACSNGEQNLSLKGCSKFRNYRLKLVWLAGRNQCVAL